MPRPATGTVVEPKGDRKSWGIRFRVNGKRQFESLGRTEDGWHRERAEEVLEDRLAAVRLGVWKPPAVEVEVPTGEQTFIEFASDWFRDREPEWRESTAKDYRWALEVHLLPVFGSMPLAAISVEDVDRYARAKQRQARLSNNSINKTLNALSTILDLAVDWGRIPRNPAKGKNRRLRGEPRQRLHVEPEQLMALLDAAHPSMRPLLSTLAGAGLRIGEAIALTWADVNLASGTIRVKESKTAAGVRVVDMPQGLSAELRNYKARSRSTAPTARVFRMNRSHEAQTIRNAQRRLKQTIKDANVKLAQQGIEQISEKVSPHSLRRTFASLRFGAGEDAIYVAEQGGWDDPGLPMRIYAKALRRRSKLSGATLKAFDAAIDWARMGTEADLPDLETAAVPLVERDPAPKRG